ncbi:Uncharacterized protein Adt_06961 [Abeliophyllum distichum]|uniref:Uncharacterized protein n=1 Tax=Abeliophyllum distichum TaxID=126358 RepID=A0ABD1V8D2_9LAMI
MSLSKNPPESMQELLRKGDKYVDAKEAERVTKSLHEGREPETNKRKSHDNQRVRDHKGKQKVGPRDQPQSNKWPSRPYAADFLTWDALLGLKAPLEKLRLVTTLLQGFGGATVTPEGTIELPVTLGTYLASITIVTKFLVVKTPMAYNAIYGRPLLNAAGAVVSTYH